MRGRRSFAVALVSALITGATFASPSPAHADDTTPGVHISSNHHGFQLDVVGSFPGGVKLSVMNGVVESNIPVLDCVITPPRPAEFAYAGSCKGAQRATEVDVWMLHALDSPLDATIVASQQVLVQGSNAGDHIDVTLLQKGRTGRTAHRGPSATIYAGNGDNDITLAGSNGYIVGGDGNDTITLKPATLGAAVFPGKGTNVVYAANGHWDFLSCQHSGGTGANMHFFTDPQDYIDLCPDAVIN